MNNLPHLIISADAIAIPESISAISESVIQDIDDYISRLLDYGNFYDEKWLNVYVDENDLNSLQQENLYPLTNTLKKILRNSENALFTTKDISLIINKCFQNVSSIKREYGFEFSLGEKFESVPDISNFTANSNFINQTKYHLVLSAIIKEGYFPKVPEYHIILKDAPTTQIEIKAHVANFKNDTNEALKLPIPPNLFKGTALVCKDLSGLVKNIDENQLFLKATNEMHLKTAIKIALFKYCIQNDPSVDWHKLNSKIPKIGKKLLTSYKENCMNRGKNVSQKILRAIVETIESEKMSAVHDLRTNGNANNPQIKRESDEATACRRDVDRKIHLHYWKSGEVIELAYITGKHDDFCIPE